MKHTPGPWKAVSSAVCAEIECMEIAEVAHMRVIPQGGGWPTPGNPEDDARLIAAAPDLLEALQSLINADPYAGADTEEGAKAVVQAHAAIAKATQ